ncbi:MAG: NAD+ synthase [Pseudomonadota bacterium]
MKIAIAQLNCIVGDLPGNAQKIRAAAKTAKEKGAHVLLTPELSLTGYPPEDLLLRDDFYRASDAALQTLTDVAHGIALIVGLPRMVQGCRYNAAAVLQEGKVTHWYHKWRLPNYHVFDEERYFEPGGEPCIFEVDGIKLGVNICEDIWFEGSATRAAQAGAQALLVLNASPYHMDKQASRYNVVRSRVAESGLPLVFANLVGGQDELVFDGASFVVDADQQVVCQLPAFKESLEIAEFDGQKFTAGHIEQSLSQEASVYQALCLGVHDYVTKNGFPGILLGLSGGIDSALTLAIAVDSLGAEKVHAVMMPSAYTASMSVEDSREMVNILGVRYSEIPISPVFDAFKLTLANEFSGRPEDTTEENLQARIRGTLLMALSNKFGSIVLTTANKSETAVGYSTLYGDMAGGFCVLKDIFKTLVYRLARYRNSISPVIPERIIVRPPSAELRPDQTDQDSLPPYDVLDAIVEAFMERDRSPKEIIAMGYAPEDVKRVTRLIQINEYKRRQAAVGVRITARGFGKDWRYPITSKYLPEF